MRTIQPRNPNWPYLLVGDIIVFVVSVFSSWFIRATLNDLMSQLLYEFSSLLKILPWMVGVRLAGNLFSDVYSVRMGRLRIHDISRIFLVYTIPTAIYLLLRVYAQNYFLKLPFSMIAFEYALSVFGSIFIRLAYINFQYRMLNRRSTHIPEYLIYGDTNELSSLQLGILARSGKALIYGILSPNPMQWESQYQSIPVIGDIESAARAIKYNDSIEAIVIPDRNSVTKKRIKRLLSVCQDLNLSLVEINEGQALYLRNNLEENFHG